MPSLLSRGTRDSGEALSPLGLQRLRQRAMRKGIWFRALSVLERGVANLTIRYVKEPKSRGLIGALSKIVIKLTAAIKLGFLYLLEERGRPVAEQHVSTALSWGNEEARRWMSDRWFWRFLGLNTSSSSWSLGRGAT